VGSTFNSLYLCKGKVVIGRACSTYGEKQNSDMDLVGKPEENEQYEDVAFG
jgi:hypothetical protein